MDWCTPEGEHDFKKKEKKRTWLGMKERRESCVEWAAAAEGKCGTGEGDNGRTWGLGTVAKDYGIWGKAHGMHPA